MLLDADCRYPIKQNTLVFVSKSQELQKKFHEFTMKFLSYEFQIHENPLVRKYACSDQISKMDGEWRCITLSTAMKLPKLGTLIRRSKDVFTC